MVGYLDDLESPGLDHRLANASDRRINEVSLTPAGEKAFLLIAGVGRRHEKAMTADLTDAERAELLRLLEKVADGQGLTAGVHPGYRSWS